MALFGLWNLLLILQYFLFINLVAAFAYMLIIVASIISQGRINIYYHWWENFYINLDKLNTLLS